MYLVKILNAETPLSRTTAGERGHLRRARV